MNQYEVSFKIFSAGNCIGRDSIIVTAKSTRDAEKRASMLIDVPHSIIVASLINCPVS